MENREINDTLSDQQRIYLIGKILSSKGLSGVLEAVDAVKNGLDVEIPGLDRKLENGEKINQINYKKPSEPIETPTKEQTVEPVINPSITTNPTGASIYREGAEKLVVKDRENISVADPVVPPMGEAHKEDNLWSGSGIKTVFPGQFYQDS